MIPAMPSGAPGGASPDTDASERRALEAAVAEARASAAAGRVTPHAEARAELLDFIARACRRIADPGGQASP